MKMIQAKEVAIAAIRASSSSKRPDRSKYNDSTGTITIPPPMPSKPPIKPLNSPKRRHVKIKKTCSN